MYKNRQYLDLDISGTPYLAVDYKARLQKCYLPQRRDILKIMLSTAGGDK